MWKYKPCGEIEKEIHHCKNHKKVIKIICLKQNQKNKKLICENKWIM